MGNFVLEIIEIQRRLKAPKNQFNSFGNYPYRSAEDIIEAVKPIYTELNCALVCDTDTFIMEGWHYVRVAATIYNSKGDYMITNGVAREEEVKKGMDASQITGAAESYAKKRALGNLFALDDTKDADATNTHEGEVKPARRGRKAQVVEAVTPPAVDEDTVHAVELCTTTMELQTLWQAHPEWAKDKAICALVTRKKNELNK